ncbi:MAG: TetR/AcrR family transcriptional regulator [Hyphomonadaceae bacterium]
MAAKAATKGGQTRERLLQLAEDAVLRQGFAATSLEALIAAAGITKSGFLYHFRDKHDLAKALLQRYLEHDDALLDALFAKADDLIDDPLHAYLAFLKLFAGVMADLPARHPGCMVASYCYQDQLHSREIRAMSAAGMMAWRTRFRARLERIAARYPPRVAVDLDALADMTITLVEGGIILDKGRRTHGALAQQILMLRDFVRLVFAP